MRLRSLTLAAVAGFLLGSNCENSDDAEPPAPAAIRPVGAFKSGWYDHYLVHYGTWDDAQIAIAKTYPLVILHPAQPGMTRSLIAAIQGGVDPADPADDVVVLGYVSIGEDVRTNALTDEQMRADPRFAGDGSGPRVDPRGPHADGHPLGGIDPRGAPSPGGTGFASWYLDDNSVDRNGTGDGRPDRNGKFGGCFVNAGDPAWFAALDGMTIDEPHGRPGLREILTTSHGRGLGCDGLFLDTIDTCAPNSFTDASSPNQSEFEWTAPGFSTFIRRLRDAYPGALILQNRGLFFFDPRHPHFEFTTRGSVDFVLFESFRLNSNLNEQFNPLHYADNRHNIAPKLVAEANRPDGFQVLSLGYAAGPGLSEATLVGASTEGLDSLLEDIRVTQDVHGFRHYLTSESIRVNTFVRDHADLGDAAPPVWSSTYNAAAPVGGLPGAPAPREGLQEVVSGPGSLTVRWDVALDKHRVGYALYYRTTPFDFGADPALASATRVVLTPRVGSGYGRVAAAFPYEATVTGLAPGVTYYLVLRAFDASPAANEERNQVVRTGTPGS